MSLIPWKPFSSSGFDDFDKFFNNDDWLLPVFPRGELSKPAMDVYETEKDIVAEVNVPDFDPDKIDVSVEDGMLRISGEMEEKSEEKEKEKGYWKKEIRKGSFERMVRLPVAVKEDDVSAVYEKGVLKITLPKAEIKPVSKVKVEVKEKK